MYICWKRPLPPNCPRSTARYDGMQIWHPHHFLLDFLLDLLYLLHLLFLHLPLLHLLHPLLLLLQLLLHNMKESTQLVQIWPPRFSAICLKFQSFAPTWHCYYCYYCYYNCNFFYYCDSVLLQFPLLLLLLLKLLLLQLLLRLLLLLQLLIVVLLLLLLLLLLQLLLLFVHL